MVITQARSRRKPTGGLLRSTLTKRTYMLGRNASMTKIGDDERRKRVPTKGGNAKQRLFETETANVYDPKTKKHKKAKITNVAENPANRNFVRRNILTKGTIIETEAGKAKVTNRPGQNGTVDAVLL